MASLWEVSTSAGVVCLEKMSAQGRGDISALYILGRDLQSLDSNVPLVSSAVLSICSPVDSDHSKHSVKISSDL